MNERKRKDTIICDLDGTLANCEHRVHYVRDKPKNWDMFFIFCSGRPERCREDTEWWLQELCRFGRNDYTLLMRKDGDRREDYIVKQEILDEHIDKERVLFVLDDRQQVVDMWRRNGLACFQVAEGNF